MPKIPLYNKGLGPTIKTPTGSLSPRASAGAFMQQGQAQAKFFQTASKIAFDFAKEQQRQETNTVLSEQSTEFDKQQFDFVVNNQDTDTTKFGANFDAFSKGFLDQIDTRPDLNDTQKRLIKEKLAPAIGAARVQGARQAFNRGRDRDKKAINAELETIINKLPTLAPDSAERDRIQTRAYDLINDSVAQNLNIDYTRQSFDQGVALTDLQVSSENTKSIAGFDALRSNVKSRDDIGMKSKTALLSKIDQDESDYRSDLYQVGVQFIRTSEATFDEARAAKEQLDKGGVIVLGGKEFDSKDLQPTQRGQLSAILNGEMSDIQDLSSQTVSNGINRAEDPFQFSVEQFKAENRSAFPGTDSELESVIGNSAQDIAQNVKAQIAAGDIANVNQMLFQMDAATKMINHSYTGMGSLLERDGPLGDQARKTQLMLANAQKDLTKAVNTGNKNSLMQLSLGKRNFHQTATDLGATAAEKKTAVDSAMTSLRSEQGELFNQPQLNVASGNAVVWDFWKTNLEASSNLITDPSFKLDDSELGTQNRGAIAQSFQLYKAMKIRGNVLNSHITNDDVMATYEAIETLEPYYGLDGAIEQVRGFDKDIERANAKYKQIEAEVNTIVEGTGKYKWYSYIPFFEGAEYMAVNKASMANDVGELTKLMIRKGLEPEPALKAAATLYGERHIRVMNVVLPKTDMIPTQEEAQALEGNMVAALEAVLGIEKEPLEFTADLTEIRPEFAREAAVISNKREQAIKSGSISGKIDFVADNYDINDLMFIPRVPGSYDEWTLVTTTLQPVFMNDQGTPLILTDDQLMMYGDIVGYEAKERARIQRNAELFIENNHKLNSGPFAGMSLQKAQQEKERLQGVPVIDFDAGIEWLFGDKKTRQEKANQAIENWENWVN